MAIADKLTHLNTTKTLLREAITRAGHYLTEADPFREYPYALLKDEHSLSLDFLRGEYIAKNWRDGTVSRVGFDNIITFTRGSGGGRFNHLGVYEWVGSNVARIDHDPATVVTSTSSVTIGAGLKTFAVSRLYPVGQYVRATADASNWMAGRVTASTGSSVTLWVDRVVGTGTHASWTLIRVMGLLVEESRTNLVTMSSTTPRLSLYGTANGCVVAPSSDMSYYGTESVKHTSTGVVNDTFYQLGNNSLNGLTPGKTYTASVMIYAPSGVTTDVDLRIYWRTAAGTYRTAFVSTTSRDEWVKLVVTANIPLGATEIFFRIRTHSLPAGKFVYFDGVQLEDGAFHTSHIPTTSSQVTRAADVATVADATDWRSPEGTFVLEHDAPSTRQLLSSGANLLMTSQGSGKIAVAFTAGGSLVCYNGGTPVAGQALTFDTALKLMGGAASFANAHASGLQFIPRALTATELQAITS